MKDQLSDGEIICTFMGWSTEHFFEEDFETWLTLDALWEVEDRLTKEQFYGYSNRLLELFAPEEGSDEIRLLLHATPEQKTTALAVVLWPIVEAGGIR